MNARDCPEDTSRCIALADIESLDSNDVHRGFSCSKCCHDSIGLRYLKFRFQMAHPVDGTVAEGGNTRSIGSLRVLCTPTLQRSYPPFRCAAFVLCFFFVVICRATRVWRYRRVERERERCVHVLLRFRCRIPPPSPPRRLELIYLCGISWVSPVFEGCRSRDV